MKPKLNLTVLIVMLMFSVTNIKAQTPASAFTSAHLQAAQNFLVATGISTQFGKLAENIINAFSNQIPENNRSAFVGVMQKFMQKYYTWDNLKEPLSEIYANEFTENELNQLTAFYNTPVGKKYGEKVTLLTQKGMSMGQQIVKDHQPELEQMMKDAMPAAKK